MDPFTGLAIVAFYKYHNIPVMSTTSNDHLIKKVIFLLPKLINMGITTYTQDYETPVAPARMFKALVTEAEKILPELTPDSIKSIERDSGNLIITQFTNGQCCRRSFLFSFSLHSNFSLVNTISDAFVFIQMAKLRW